MGVTHDTWHCVVIVWSSHHSVSPSPSHLGSRRHVSHVWDRDQYCITDENSEKIHPSIFHILHALLLRSMLKVRKSYKYFDQRKTPNIYNFPLANNADENKESCTIKHCLFKDNYLGPVWIHLHIHTERMVLDFGIRASFYTIIIT